MIGKPLTCKKNSSAKKTTQFYQLVLFPFVFYFNFNSKIKVFTQS